MWERLPPPAELLKRPITSGLALAAIAVTLAWWGGSSVDALTMTRDAVGTESWRLLTSALPHVGLPHLVFNVYWLVVIGGAIESRCGAILTIGLVLLTGIASAALEHALFDGGVGLSGIGYGLFGFAWIASRRERIFADVVDPRTVRLFVAWFFVCVATTIAGVMSVANAAHAGGWAIGALAGLAWSDRGRRALGAGATALVALACVGLASPALRPMVNVEGLDQDLADEGFAMVERDPARAAELYAQAISRDDGVGNWHYNRGVALERSGDVDGAVAEYHRALELEPGARTYSDALASAHAGRANRALAGDRTGEAIEALREALDASPDHEFAAAWRAALEQLESTQ